MIDFLGIKDTNKYCFSMKYYQKVQNKNQKGQHLNRCFKIIL